MLGQSVLCLGNEDCSLLTEFTLGENAASLLDAEDVNPFISDEEDSEVDSDFVPDSDSDDDSHNPWMNDPLTIQRSVKGFATAIAEADEVEYDEFKAQIASRYSKMKRLPKKFWIM